MDTRVEQWPSLISRRLISNKRFIQRSLVTRWPHSYRSCIRFVIIQVAVLTTCQHVRTMRDREREREGCTYHFVQLCNYAARLGELVTRYVAGVEWYGTGPRLDTRYASYLLRVIFEYVNTISCSFMWESKCYLLRDSSRVVIRSVVNTVDVCNRERVAKTTCGQRLRLPNVSRFVHLWMNELLRVIRLVLLIINNAYVFIINIPNYSSHLGEICESSIPTSSPRFKFQEHRNNNNPSTHCRVKLYV